MINHPAIKGYPQFRIIKLLSSQKWLGLQMGSFHPKSFFHPIWSWIPIVPIGSANLVPQDVMKINHASSVHDSLFPGTNDVKNRYNWGYHGGIPHFPLKWPQLGHNWAMPPIRLSIPTASNQISINRAQSLSFSMVFFLSGIDLVG